MSLVDVIFTPLASRQIDTLYQYISEHSNETRADGYVTRIIAYCNGFAVFPQRGPRAMTCCLACV